MAPPTTQDLMDRLEAMTLTLNDVKDKVDTCNSNINQCSEKCDSVIPRVVALEKDIAVMKREVTTLKESNIRLEGYLRRDNLLFGGILETVPENCEEKLRNFIETTLNVPCDDIKFVRVHRLGKKQAGKCRPIIARFHFFGDRQRVFGERHSVRNSTCWIAEDFPWEVQQRRRVLKPILRQAITKLGPDSAYLSGDRLVIRGVTYTVDNLSNLPPDLQLANISTPHIEGNIVAFYNEFSPFSNFHRANFTVEGRNYVHVEQFFTAKKAEINGNVELHEQIMNEESPYKCKALARQLQNSVEWKREQEQVMIVGCTAKFEQNRQLMDFLLKTENKTLIEARADDKYWGAGLNHTDPKLKGDKLPGKNKLGKILMKIRLDNQ
jgi:ribA/ribD-fused uncharacterized protein